MERIKFIIKTLIGFTAVLLLMSCGSTETQEDGPVNESDIPEGTYTAAVLPLNPKGVVLGFATTTANTFINELEGTDKFAIVDRVNMNQIIKDAEEAYAGISANEKAAKIGKMLNVEYIFTGTIEKLIDSEIRVTIHLIEVETALLVNSRTDTASSPDSIDRTVSSLARSFIFDAGKKGEASSDNGKPSLAVLDFEPKGVMPQYASSISESLNPELIDAGNFNVVDRQNLDTVIDEIETQMSGLTGSKRIAEIGKIIGMDYIISGSVSKGEGDELRVSVAMTDVENASVVYTKIINGKDKEDIIDELAGVAKSLDANTLTERKTVAVEFLPVNVVSFYSDQLEDSFIDGISKQRDLIIIDNDKLQLIYKEQELHLAGITANTKAKRLGEIGKASYLLKAAVSKDEDNKVEVNIQVYSTAGGEKVLDITERSRSTDSAKGAMYNAAEKVCRVMN